jgi:sugar transferase (PEP-CTERM system associated)
MIKVFSHWVHGATLTRLLVDFAFLLVGTAIALTWISEGLPISLGPVVLYALLLAPITLAFNGWLGIYQRRRERVLYDTVARALMSLYLATPIASGILAAFPSVAVDQSFVELSLIVGVYGMLVNRVRSIHFSRQRKLRILVLGTGDQAVDVRRNLFEFDPDVEVVGFFDSQPDAPAELDGAPIFGRGEPLLDVVRRIEVDEIIVAVVERRNGVLPLRDLLDCKLIGVTVVDLATHFERRLGQIRLDALKAGWLIFGEGFNQTLARQVVKRISDISGSVILLVLAAPVMLLTAILIVLEDGLPIFYRQQRVGRDGRTFDVIKFRSMRTDAEKDGKPRFATANDDRTTRVGRIIRKLRVDELPQLINVLKGDMSIVGPRPERPFFVDQLTRMFPFYAARHSVKPGITGWAQVRYAYGETMEDAAQKLQYDLYYVKNHSVLLDTLVLFETVAVVLTGKGAR